MGFPCSDGEVEVFGAVSGGIGWRRGRHGGGGACGGGGCSAMFAGKEQNDGQDERLDKIVHTNKLYLEISKGLVFFVGQFWYLMQSRLIIIVE